MRSFVKHAGVLAVILAAVMLLSACSNSVSGGSGGGGEAPANPGTEGGGLIVETTTEHHEQITFAPPESEETEAPEETMPPEETSPEATVPEESTESETDPPESDSPAQAGELTAEELQFFQDYFYEVEHNGFLTHMYTDIYGLDFYEVMYNLYDDDDISEDEYNQLGVTKEERDIYSFRKLSASRADEILRNNTGAGLEDIFPDYMYAQNYLPDYNSFYTASGDTNFRPVTCLSGTRMEDGTVEITYDSGYGGETWIVTLVSDGDHYLFLANISPSEVYNQQYYNSIDMSSLPTVSDDQFTYYYSPEERALIVAVEGGEYGRFFLFENGKCLVITSVDDIEITGTLDYYQDIGDEVLASFAALMGSAD